MATVTSIGGRARVGLSFGSHSRLDQQRWLLIEYPNSRIWTLTSAVPRRTSQPRGKTKEFTKIPSTANIGAIMQ
jgi:hypothetical protein